MLHSLIMLLSLWHLQYSKGDDWSEYVVVDGKLITGQNPQVCIPDSRIAFMMVTAGVEVPATFGLPRLLTYRTTVSSCSAQC